MTIRQTRQIGTRWPRASAPSSGPASRSSRQFSSSDFSSTSSYTREGRRRLMRVIYLVGTIRTQLLYLHRYYICTQLLYLHSYYTYMDTIPTQVLYLHRYYTYIGTVPTQVPYLHDVDDPDTVSMSMQCASYSVKKNRKYKRYLVIVIVIVQAEGQLSL